MRDEVIHKPYRVVIVTLDQHSAGPAARVMPRLAADFPGLQVSVHAAAEWAESPEALQAAKADVGEANIIVASVLFLEEHINAILPDLTARRDGCDALVGVIADTQIVKLTKMGDLDMAKPASGAMALLKKLRGKAKPNANSGAKQMKLLRRLPKILKLVPGKAQDLRAWFLAMQYWLGGNDENIESMMRFLVGRYARNPEMRVCAGLTPSCGVSCSMNCGSTANARSRPSRLTWSVTSPGM